ncbi:MAG: hypothetical protein ABIO92_07975, partial [Chloroflexia bacterium]
GVLVSLLADWGEWDRFGISLLWRILIITVGGLLGLVLNYFGGNYVSMGTNVIESMGITKFSGDARQKIENAFIFVGAFLGAIVALIFI